MIYFTPNLIERFGSDDDRIAPVAQTELKQSAEGNPDTHKFVVNPGKPGKLRVGKSKSPAKMGARSPRENGCLKPRRWVPEAP